MKTTKTPKGVVGVTTGQLNEHMQGIVTVKMDTVLQLGFKPVDTHKGAMYWNPNDVDTIIDTIIQKLKELPRVHAS